MSDFNLWNGILDKIISLLPLSPFKGVITGLQGEDARQILAYLNWFIPIHDFLIVLASWLGVISLYYVYVIVLRWIKVIK